MAGLVLRSRSLMRIVLLLTLLVQLSLATIENNDEHPAIENETISDNLSTESVPDPITIEPPGSTEQLRPNLVGLANMAIVHLPKRLAFEHVIQATREIVDGVRYELIVNAQAATKSEVICRLVILERPWITTEAGDKFRELVTTNCTVDSEDDKFEPSKYEGNTIFNSSNTQLTHGELSDLEEQILVGKKKKPALDEKESKDKEGSITLGVINRVEMQIVPEKTTTIAPDLSEDSLSYLSSLFGIDPDVMGSFTTQKSPIDVNSESEGLTTLSSSAASSESSNALKVESPPIPKDISDDSKSFLDSLFLKPIVEPEHKVEHATKPTIICGDNSDARQSNAIYRYAPDFRDVKASKSDNIAVLDSVLKTLPVQNENQETMPASKVTEATDINIESNAVTQDSMQGMTSLQTGSNFEELSNVIPIKEVIADAAKSRPCNLQVAEPGMPGGSRGIDEAEYPTLEGDVEKILLSSSKLEADSQRIIKLEQLICATTQVVAGTLKKIEGRFRLADGTLKDCVLEIWSRPWLNSQESSINCNYPKKPTPRNRRSIRENQREIFERVQEFLPAAKIKKANGQPLYYKVHQIYEATERRDNSDYVYVIRGRFEMPDGEEDICKMVLTQQANRLNIFNWKCVDEDVDFVFSFYPSVLTIPRSKRTKEQNLFAKFILNHKRDYAHTPEEEARFKIFSFNLQKIKIFNEMEQGTAKYGITELADLTEEEYSMRTGLRYDEYASDNNHIRNPMARIPNRELPRSFDWRQKGAVTQVKNQGACGSCWAFSVTGNIEGIHAVKTGKLEEYSEQELVDCDTMDHGCGGGLPDNAYKAIEHIGGLELEDEYPYKARQAKCSFNKTMSHVRVKGAIDFPKNETAMALWLVENGPISIGINANAMQFYRGGISHPWRMLCRHSAIDHGVLIVGFGVAEYPVFNKTIPYWIVKNSWGKGWGEQGYYRVYRGDDTCGVGEMASSAVLAD